MARFILGQLVLHVLRRDRWMKAWYGRIKKRRGSKIARVAVMRRLATIIWQMVKHNEPYTVAVGFAHELVADQGDVEFLHGTLLPERFQSSISASSRFK